MPALNPRITEGSDLVRDSTPTPQQRAQSVLMGLAHIRGCLEGIELSDPPLGTLNATVRALGYCATAETILQPLAYPRLTEEKR